MYIVHIIIVHFNKDNLQQVNIRLHLVSPWREIKIVAPNRAPHFHPARDVSRGEAEGSPSDLAGIYFVLSTIFLFRQGRILKRSRRISHGSTHSFPLFNIAAPHPLLNRVSKDSNSMRVQVDRSLLLFSPFHLATAFGWPLKFFHLIF